MRFFNRLLVTIIAVLAMQDFAAARTCEGLFQPADRLISTVLERLNKYRRIETELGVPEEHQTAVSLIRDERKQPIKTATSVLLIHGLYNSPKAFAALAAHYHSLGMNVINLRLSGHYEADKTAMQDGVRWQQWVKDVRRALALARELGDSVLLGGHSTGALAATWLAVENPKAIRGLVLFAPAFRVRLKQQFGARLIDFLNIDLNPPSGRLITGHAGSEVTEMANAFARSMLRAPEMLAEIPIWMANTRSDRTIDVEVADRFVSGLTRFEPGEAQRLSVILPSTLNVLHDALAGERNPEFPTLVQSMDEFFGFKRP